MMDRGEIFAKRTLGVPEAEAFTVAANAVTFAWEECKFGRSVAEDASAFWKIVSERLYKTRNDWRSRELSLDAPIPNSEGDADGHEAGWNGYLPPDQIEVTFLNEVKAGIRLLPLKHSTVMSRLADGHNALDISAEMRIPLHTVFRVIAEARQFLWGRELIAMAGDPRRQRILENT